MKKRKLALALITMGIAAGIAHAEVINIAMHNGGVTVGSFDTAPDGTVVSAGSNGSDTWNNIRKDVDGTNFTGRVLLLDDGASSGATLASATEFGSYVSGIGSSTDDHVMMTGWYGFQEAESMTVSSLPTAFTSEGYNVTIYSSVINRTMNYTIGGTTKTIASHADKFDGTFVEGTDFVTFTGLTGTDFTITGNPSTDGRSSISGISISVINDAGYTLIYSAGENGTISGTTTQTVANAESGSEVEAVPDTGYQFVDWSDGSTENPRTDLNVIKDLSVTANFAVPTGVEIVNYVFSGNTTFASFVDGDGPITIQDIAGTANGKAFTFDLTLSAVSGNGDGFIDFNNQSPLLDADSGVTRANSLTLTISNFSGAPGQMYDGIVGVNKYDNGGGDDWDIADQTISGSGTTYTELTNPITGAMTINTIDNAPDANGNSRFEGFSISVSTDGSLKEVGTITVGGTATLPGGGEGLILSWTGFSGQNYSVESRVDLMSGDWGPYTNAIGVYTNIPGIDGSMVVTTKVDKVEEFYQVIAE